MKKSSVGPKKHIPETNVSKPAFQQKTNKLATVSVSSSEFHTWEKGTDDGSNAAQEIEIDSSEEESESDKKIRPDYSGNVFGKTVKSMPVVFDNDTDDSDNENKVKNNEIDEYKSKESDNENENRLVPKLALQDMLTPEQIIAKEEKFKDLLNHVKLALKTSVFSFEAAMGELEITRSMIEKSDIVDNVPNISSEKSEQLRKKLDNIQFPVSEQTNIVLIAEEVQNKCLDSKVRSDIMISKHSTEIMTLSGVPKTVISEDLSDALPTSSSQDEDNKSIRKMSSIKAKYQQITNSNKKIPIKFNTANTPEFIDSECIALDAKTVYGARNIIKEIDLSTVRITKSSKEYSFMTTLNPTAIQDGPTLAISSKTDDKNMESVEEQTAFHNVFARYKRNSIGFDLREISVEEVDSFQKSAEDIGSVEKEPVVENAVIATNAFRLLTTTLRSSSEHNSTNNSPRLDLLKTGNMVYKWFFLY